MHFAPKTVLPPTVRMLWCATGNIRNTRPENGSGVGAGGGEGEGGASKGVMARHLRENRLYLYIVSRTILSTHAMQPTAAHSMRAALKYALTMYQKCGNSVHNGEADNVHSGEANNVQSLTMCSLRQAPAAHPLHLVAHAPQSLHFQIVCRCRITMACDGRARYVCMHHCVHPGPHYCVHCEAHCIVVCWTTLQFESHACSRSCSARPYRACISTPQLCENVSEECGLHGATCVVYTAAVE